MIFRVTIADVGRGARMGGGIEGGTGLGLELILGVSGIGAVVGSALATSLRGIVL